MYQQQYKPDFLILVTQFNAFLKVANQNSICSMSYEIMLSEHFMKFFEFLPKHMNKQILSRRNN